MKNFHSTGGVISVVAPADVDSGAGVLVGSIFGIAQGSAATGVEVNLVRIGVYTMPKVNAQAWAQGAKIYWDNGNSQMTTTASGNVLVGTATEAAANPSETGMVLLDGAAR